MEKRKITKKEGNGAMDKGEWADFALMHLQIAKRFGLPKEKMKSELETMLSRLSQTDLAKAVEESADTHENNYAELVTENYYKRVLDEAVKIGIDRKLITKAAYQITRGALAAYDYNGGGIIESEDELLEIKKKYGVSNKDILKAFMERYDKDFK